MPEHLKLIYRCLLLWKLKPYEAVGQLMYWKHFAEGVGLGNDTAAEEAIGIIETYRTDKWNN